MKRLFTILLIGLFSLCPSYVNANARIIASTSVLASIAKEIGAELVKVDYICPSGSNPHSIEVMPSYMIKVARADVYLKIGMGLDFWANPIIDGSRNGKLVIVDCSEGIVPLEVPTEKVNASMGDLHVQGNPHYWLDPSNGLLIAMNILNGLIKIDPSNRQAYQEGYDRFRSVLLEKIDIWRKKALPLQGKQIVTFHNSWPYFAKAFGLKVAGFVEPKPGIEPTPSHTAELISLIRALDIQLIGKEPYFSDRVPRSIAAATGVKVVILPPSVGGAYGIDNYFGLFDYLLDELLNSEGE